MNAKEANKQIVKDKNMNENREKYQESGYDYSSEIDREYCHINQAGEDSALHEEAKSGIRKSLSDLKSSLSESDEVISYDDFQCEGIELPKFKTFSGRKIALSKPRPPDLFRCHPEGIYFVRSHAIETNENNTKDWYLVKNQIAKEVCSVPGFNRFAFAFYITDSGTKGLWPVKLVKSPHFANVSCVVKLAESMWIRTEWSDEEKTYKATSFDGEVPFEPKWEEHTPASLLSEAFAGKVISSTSHPVVRKYLGGKRIL